MKRALLVLTLLGGCASALMEGYIGKDINSVVARYGPYENTFKAKDGVTAFQWRYESELFMPMTTSYSGTSYGNTTYGTATTSGGYLGSEQCFYTLYAKPNKDGSHTIVGFEKPRFACE